MFVVSKIIKNRQKIVAFLTQYVSHPFYLLDLSDEGDPKAKAADKSPLRIDYPINIFTKDNVFYVQVNRKVTILASIEKISLDIVKEKEIDLTCDCNYVRFLYYSTGRVTEYGTKSFHFSLIL
jgi:hypothetical protein